MSRAAPSRIHRYFTSLRGLRYLLRLLPLTFMSVGLLGIGCVPATSYEQVSSAEEVEAESHRRTVEAYRKLLALKNSSEITRATAEQQLENEKGRSSNLKSEKSKAEKELAQGKEAEANAHAAHKELSSELSRSSDELAKSESQLEILKNKLAQQAEREQEKEAEKLEEMQARQRAETRVKELSAELGLLKLQLKQRSRPKAGPEGALQAGSRVAATTP